MTKRILLTGANGQLGSEIRQRVSMMPLAYELLPTDQADLDITQEEAVEAAVKAFKPDVIINAAAYTAVDKAESEPDIAFAVNAKGPENLAKVASDQHVRLIHISTDYVFNGRSSSPWQVDDRVEPINVYGESKLAGETAIQRYCAEAMIIRTAWVYSRYGHNFVKTMINLMNSRDQLGVIYDQIGAPTHAGRLAEICLSAIDKPEHQGVYHWTDAGVASWYDFAYAVYTLGTELGLINHNCQIDPITTADYPTPARRPQYSVMDCQQSRQDLGFARHWREQLTMMLQELQQEEGNA